MAFNVSYLLMHRGFINFFTHSGYEIFSLVCTKAKTQEMKFCNNSNTLFALLLNSLLLQFTLQQFKNTLCTTFELTKGQ